MSPISTVKKEYYSSFRSKAEHQKNMAIRFASSSRTKPKALTKYKHSFDVSGEIAYA